MAAHSRLAAAAFAVFLAAVFSFSGATVSDGGGCLRGCSLALASFTVSTGQLFGRISTYFNVNDYHALLPYNPDMSNVAFIYPGQRIDIPFRCDCVAGSHLAGVFSHNATRNETLESIADVTYSHLVTVDSLKRLNPLPMDKVREVKVEISCYCGDASVSKDYGLFLTYPMSATESLDSVGAKFSVSPALLRSYNPNATADGGSRILFVPVEDPNGSYRPLQTSTATNFPGGAIAGIAISTVVVLVLLGICCFVFRSKHRLRKNANFLMSAPRDTTLQATAASITIVSPTTPIGRTTDRSIKFSYDELALATNNFSTTNKIGQGGFGSVYYGEIKGEKVAIKRMDMQASQEFLAELKVLANVHHLNLVHLIGYCTEISLFLVYEYIENGNLSEHLHKPDREILPWTTRVQIALDTARGLEYIHEHAVPVYIHRDIKSVNILIDKNFRAKVADFGLAKLTEGGSVSRLAGTCGYMPPEYARYGDVSQKVDVYALGVVLFELISAKEAVIRSNALDGGNTRGLVVLFEEALGLPDPEGSLRKLIDPRLGDRYPIDLVLKMAQLATACTRDEPKVRPTMRFIVVELMTLWSATELWARNAGENHHEPPSYLAAADGHALA